jgi:hypothetical protein
LNPKASPTIRTPDGFAVEVSGETPLDVLGRSLRVLRQINSETIDSFNNQWDIPCVVWQAVALVLCSPETPF